MPNESIEVVRAAFEAWREGDSMVGYLSDKVEWEVRPDLPDASRYTGHDGFLKLGERFNEVMEEMWFRPSEFIAAGENLVVVPLRWGGRGKGSGVPFEERNEAWVFTVSDGKITRVKEFVTRQEALAEVALRDAAPRTSSPS